MSQVDLVGFSCAACGKQYRWKPELAGKKVRCKCGSAVVVPAGNPSADVARSANEPGIAAARSAEVPPRAPRAGAMPPPPPPPPAPKRQEYRDPFADDDGTSDNDGAGDMDALAALAQSEAAASDDAMAGHDAQFCANCRARMSPDAVLCTSCGYDRRRGSVMSAAKVKDPNKRFFGLLNYKQPDPKKPVDKLAPQGSFFVGVAASAGLALAAAFLWFVIAYGLERELKALCLLIGVGAGVGMQIGQKGYSTLGGFAAGAIALVTIFVARLAVILAIMIPVLQKEELIDKKTGMAEAGALAVVASTAQDDFDAEEERPASKEDPRVLELLNERAYVEMGINPRFSSFEQDEAVRNRAEYMATTMPAAEKDKLIAIVDERNADDELRELLAREHRDSMAENLRYHPTQQEAIRQAVDQKFQKIPPTQRKSELARMKAKFQAEDKATRDAYVAERKQAREKAAVAAKDGLDDESDATPDELAAMSNDDEELGDEDAEMDEDDDGETSSAASASDGGGDDDEAGNAGSTAAVTFGIALILSYIVFGGIGGIILLFSTIFLAYRTAAGATWG